VGRVRSRTAKKGRGGKGKMSKADEMFEKLGYKKTYSVNNNEILMIGYGLNNEKIDECEIIFFKKAKKIIIEIEIEMQELQAINEKVKELGWNE